MNTEKKKPFYYKSSFIVLMYAGVMMALITLQVAMEIVLGLVEAGIITHWFFQNYINTNFELPMSAMAYIWTTICAAYVGVDRGAYAYKTATERRGLSDLGQPATLRKIITVSGFLFLYAVVANLMIDANFELTAFGTAFGSSMVLYVAGQKTIKLTSNMNGPVVAKEIVEEASEPKEKDAPPARHRRKHSGVALV